MQRKHMQKGFSLIELLVVATVIIVITTIGLVSFTTAGKGARDGKRKADLEAVRQALVLYKADGNTYPSGTSGNNANYTTMTATLVSGGYLSNPKPDDPKNTAPYQYTYYAPAAGDSFCLCAYAEDDDIANQATTSCGPSFLTPMLYCVQNP